MCIAICNNIVTGNDAHRQGRQSHGTGGLVPAIFDIYLNSVNCADFVQSILRKIVKIVATRLF